MAKNRNRLADLGRRCRRRDWWRSDWLVHEAEVAGLDLLPHGQWRHSAHGRRCGRERRPMVDHAAGPVTPEKLIIIEPQPAAFGAAATALRRPVLRRAASLAVGDKAGVTELHITRDTTGASVLPPREEMQDLIGGNWAVNPQIEVPMTTLDALLNDVPEISLLKIDVQGFEKAVLAGAARPCKRTNFRPHRAQLHAAIRGRLVVWRDS